MESNSIDTPPIAPSDHGEALHTENVTMSHPDVQQQQEAYYKHLSSLSDPPRASSYTPFLQEAIETNDIPRITALATFLYSSTLPLPTARSVYSALATAILNLPSEQFDHGVGALLTVHDSVPRAFAYESALLPLRERLSAEYEARGMFVQAAVVLVAIPVDTRQSLPESSLLRFNLRVARLFAAAGETTAAERFLSRAALQLSNGTDESLVLQHRAIYARLLDTKGRFVDASIKYYSLSQVAESAQYLDVMADASPALVSAVTCAILAPAGPRRSRMLAVLYNDERSRTLDLFPLLESIHMGRLLRQEQLEKFIPTLQPHQVKTLPDGDTVLDRAVMEHNMLATSRLYESIGFKELGELLGVSATKAETTAADMIYEDRMIATIDQVEGRLQFTSTSSLIERWDAHIASLCTAIDDCVEAIVSNFPQFANQLET